MRQVRPVFRFKKIVWWSTTTCDYDCVYCSPRDKDGKYRWPTAEQKSKLIDFIKHNSKEVNENRTQLDIMGGEPTLWPDFMNFCEEASKYTSVFLSSNASRTEKYYKNIKPGVINELFLSFHPERADPEHFIKIAKIMQNKTTLRILILFFQPYFDMCLKFYNQVKEMIDNRELDIRLTVQRVDVSGTDVRRTSLKDLSKEQEKIFLALEDVRSKFSLDQRSDEYNKIKEKYSLLEIPAFLVDNQEVNGQHFQNSKLNNFIGWDCYVNEGNVIRISADGSVHPSVCGITKLKYNAYNDDISNFVDEFKTLSPVTCDRLCNCGTDIKLIKKVNSLAK